MKKILLSAFAIFAMMACNNEEPVRLQEQSLITFEDSFVEAKTRAADDPDPSITTETIDAFDVWGFINKPSGVVFEKERVTKSEEGWGYTNLQYWMPEKSYYFHAVAPVDDANIVVDKTNMNTDGLGTISFTNADGTTDLLYASKHVSTVGVDVINNAPSVELKFMHLLSKIKFTFTNGFPNENTSLKVTDIKITNAPAKGSIAVNTERENFSWTLVQGETTELAFGDVNGSKDGALASLESNECAAERLTIPADATRNYTITFTLELFYGDQSAGKNDKVVTLENQEFAIGKNYNIKATINSDNFYDEALEPIKFDVEVEDWILVDFNGIIHDSESTNPEQPEQPAEPEALAQPVVTPAVEDNVVTLTWDAVEGAKAYSVQVDDGEVETVEDTTYTFTGEYGVSYTVTIKALPENEETHKESEATVVPVEIPAQTTPEPEQPTYTSVEDFLAAAEDDTIYTLKGTITSVTEYNYGNFYINDGTGEVLIWGLCSPEGASKYWAESGAKVGDDIIIKTVRTSYGNAPQGKNAIFVDLITPGSYVFWVFDATSTSFGPDAGENKIGLNIYNTDAEVEAESDNAQFSAVYTDGGLVVTALENTTSETIEGKITVTCGSMTQVVKVTQAGAGSKPTVQATLTFDDTAKRTTFTTSQQIWEESGITFTNDKSASNTNVANYSKPVRLYQNSKITVEAPGEITVIVFDCNSTSYASDLKNSIGATAEVEVSSDKVTVTLNGTSAEFVIEKLTAQVRLDAVTVTYID